MPSVEAWLSVLRAFEGVKVKHRGVKRSTGVDCSGLIIASLAEIGIEHTRPFFNGTLPSGGQVTEAVAQFCDTSDAIFPGAILQVYLGKQPRHLVVYLGENEAGQPLCIHANGNVGRVTISILTSRVFAIWKLRSLEWHPV